MEPQGDIVKVFIDESGDHCLSPQSINNSYNIFVLAAVCFNSEKAYEEFDLKFRKLKLDLFGTEDFIVHTGEINRPSKAKDKLNRKFLGTDFRNKFYQQTNELIKTTDFSIIARAINKKTFIQKYPSGNPNPYLFCFDYLLNRIIFDSPKNQTVEIYPEQRTNKDNTTFIKQFKKAKRSGTKLLPARKIRRKIINFELSNKKLNISGSQLVDLVVTPIGKHLLSKSPKPGNEIDYSIISKKIRRGNPELYPNI